MNNHIPSDAIREAHRAAWCLPDNDIDATALLDWITSGDTIHLPKAS